MSDNESKTFVLVVWDYAARPRDKKFMTEAMRRAGFSMANVVYTRFISGEPNKSKTVKKFVITESLVYVMEKIRKWQPSNVLLLGNNVMAALTGMKKITKLAGAQLPFTGWPVLWEGVDKAYGISRDECPVPHVYAALNPAYVALRAATDESQIELYVAQLRRLRELMERIDKPNTDTFQVEELKSVDAVKAFFDKGRSHRISFDTETDSVRPYRRGERVLCLSFSFEHDRGVVINWAHPGGHQWKKDDREKVLELIRNFLSDENWPKRGHNVLFDMCQVQANMGIKVNGDIADTMYDSYCRDERSGVHGLDNLARRLTDMGGYENALAQYVIAHPDANPETGGTYANVPWELLCYYAGADAVATHRCGVVMDQSLNRRLSRLSRTMLSMFLPALRDIAVNGMSVDLDELTTLERIYPERIEEIRQKILQDESVKEFVAKKRRKNPKFEFNPLSNMQKADFLFNHLKLPSSMQTDTGEDSVEQAALMPLLTKHPLVPLFLELTQTVGFYKRYLWRLRLSDKEAKKPKPSYIERDGLVHPMPKPTGTVTGRLSMASPPMQQIPRDGDVKQIFNSRFENGVLISGDMNQIELRLLAMFSGDPVMVEAYREHKDLHRLMSVVCFGEEYLELEVQAANNEEAAKQLEQKRTIGKRVNFSIGYGSFPEGLQANLQKDGIYISIKSAARYIDGFHSLYKRVNDWQWKVIEDCRERGFVQTIFGRRRHLPNIVKDTIRDADNSYQFSRSERQAINFMIQSTANDLTLLALSAVSRLLEGKKSKLIMTVHDSIIVDSPPAEAADVAREIFYTMNHIPDIMELSVPDVPRDWITVPLEADLRVGQNWKKMVKWNKKFDWDTYFAEAA